MGKKSAPGTAAGTTALTAEQIRAQLKARAAPVAGSVPVRSFVPEFGIEVETRPGTGATRYAVETEVFSARDRVGSGIELGVLLVCGAIRATTWTVPTDGSEPELLFHGLDLAEVAELPPAVLNLLAKPASSAAGVDRAEGKAPDTTSSSTSG